MREGLALYGDHKGLIISNSTPFRWLITPKRLFPLPETAVPSIELVNCLPKCLLPPAPHGHDFTVWRFTATNLGSRSGLQREMGRQIDKTWRRKFYGRSQESSFLNVKPCYCAIHKCFNPVPLFATVRHCSTSFKVQIQLDHFCIGDESYIDVYLGLIWATAKIPGQSKGEQGVKNQLRGLNVLNSPEPLKQLWLAK